MNIIVAACKNRGIGLNNKLPWELKKEMNIFKNLTKGNGKNAVIMGKNTWLSLPKALPKRDNFVISKMITTLRKNQTLPIFPSTLRYYNDFVFKKSFEDLYKHRSLNNYETKWLIGGAQCYKNLIHHENIQAIYYTDIDKEYNCDTFFPEIPNHFIKIFETDDIYDNGTKFKIKLYKNKYFLYIDNQLIDSLKTVLDKVEKKFEKI